MNKQTLWKQFSTMKEEIFFNIKYTEDEEYESQKTKTFMVYTRHVD